MPDRIGGRGENQAMRITVVRRSGFAVRRSGSSSVVRRSSFAVRRSRFAVRGSWAVALIVVAANLEPRNTHAERRTTNDICRLANLNHARRTANDERTWKGVLA